MRVTQDIYYPVTGQSLYHDCDRRPSSVAPVEVQENKDGDDAAAEAATTGSAAIDSVSTTVSATSGYSEDNPRTVNLTSVAGIVVGRVYLLINTLGASEWGEVVSIGASTVTLRHPLQHEYLTSSTFEGTRIAIGIDPTWVAENSNISASLAPAPRYRVRWEYVVGAMTVVRTTMFDLVRYAGSCSVTGLDVDSFFPGFLDHLPIHYREGQGAKLILVAYTAVKFAMRADGKADQMARDPEAVDMLVVYKANELNQETRIQLGGGSLEALEAARTAFTELYANLVREPSIPFATDSSGAAADSVDRAPLFVR